MSTDTKTIGKCKMKHVKHEEDFKTAFFYFWGKRKYPSNKEMEWLKHHYRMNEHDRTVSCMHCGYKFVPPHI